MGTTQVRRDVRLIGDLCPCPAPCPVQEQFQLLQTVLTELRLPPTRDRRDQPRSADDNDVTVVLLAETEEAVSIFFEGNRQCPDGVLLALTSSWLTRGPSPDRPGLDTLYLHQALTAEAGGQTYLDVFRPARRVTYLVNHLLGVSTDFRRTDAEELAAFGLDTPTSSSLPLSYRADDKLLTTTMCAEAGVKHPATLGFWLPGGYDHEHPTHHPTITVVKLPSRDQDADWVRRHVQDFLGSKAMDRVEKVVVKPYGPTWNSCKGVTYHESTDVTEIVHAVLDLVSLIELGNGILVQSYHPTFDPVVLPDAGRHAVNVEGIRLGLRVRAIVARTPQNGARVTQVVCGISDGDIPIGGINTVPISLPLTLQLWGVTDVRQQHSIRNSVRQSCERLMLELLRQEAQLTSEQRGGHGCQTDLLGMDLVLTRHKDAIVPVVIEVNAHDCLYHVTVLETMQARQRGVGVRTLVHTMLARSQRFLVAGRVVVVVGAGGFSKRHVWTAARQLGVKIILVDSNPDHWARREVDTFLHVEMDDHQQDRQHARAILSLLTSRLAGVRVAGCLTFWEDFVPLAALVAEGLNLRHAVSYRGAMNAKSKALTHGVLGKSRQEPPDHLPPCFYASPMVKVEGVHDVEKAVKKIPLPAVLKLEFGSGAVGVKHVRSVQEAVQHVQQVRDTLRSELDHPGVGLGHGRCLVMMTRLQGSEHDVDVVLFQGQLIAAFVSDNGPTRLPLCAETAATLPSVLHKELQCQLVSGAVSCCRGLGLLTGVFNVEMMLTPRGPRLIEINARMGGFYLRDWIRLIYGVDLVHLALLCACGVRPVLTGRSSLDEDVDDGSEDRLMGIMLYTSRHHHALKTTATPERLQRLHDDGHIVFTQFERDVDHSHSRSYEEPYGNLAVRAAGVEEARTRLIGVCTSLGLETEDSLCEILQDFVQLA